jgi:hypothetical protein
MRKLPDLQFHLDRFRGRVGEEYIAGLFRFWGYTVKEAPDRNFPAYDLWISQPGTNRAFGVEVKTDERMAQTNNACLEFDALDHSKADYLAICAGDPIKAVYLMPLDEARKFAHSYSDIREVGHLKSGKPNYAAIVPESILLTIPKCAKLIVPHNELQQDSQSPNQQVRQAMEPFSKAA